MKRSVARIYLGLLVTFLLGWDLWAVLLDGRLKLPDTFVMHTLGLWEAIERGYVGVWLHNLGPKGPLGPVLSLPLLALLGEAPLAMRLVTVLAHGALVLQSYDLGRLVWAENEAHDADSTRRAGVWAALLCGTCPFLFGICRLAYHDVLLGVAVIGSMQLMLRARLDRPGPAAALGLVLGLGLLTKHSFSLYMVGPGLWFVAHRLRGVRSAAYLGLMGVVMAPVAAVWAVPNFAAVYENLTANTSLPDVPWSAELGFYLSLPGAMPLFVLAVVSVVALAVGRQVSLWNLVLLLSFIPMVLGLHSVTAAARYMIPVIPLWSVLAACGLTWAGARLAPRLRNGALAAATVGLAALCVVLNIVGLKTDVAREDYGGITSPDTRDYDGFARAVRALGDHGEDLLLVFDSNAAFCERMSHEILWRYRGVRTNPIQLADARRRRQAGQGVSVLYIQQQPHRPLLAQVPPDLWPPIVSGEHPGKVELIQRVTWLANQKNRKLLLSTRDPDGYGFQTFRVGDGVKKLKKLLPKTQ